MLKGGKLADKTRVTRKECKRRREEFEDGESFGTKRDVEHR